MFSEYPHSLMKSQAIGNVYNMSNHHVLTAGNECEVHAKNYFVVGFREGNTYGLFDVLDWVILFLSNTVICN